MNSSNQCLRQNSNRWLGMLERGGTVRLSVEWFNGATDTKKILDGLKEANLG